LEQAFLSSPEKIPKIALVSKRTQHKLTYYHEPRWIVGPKIGPQQEVVVIPEDKEIWTPPLALEGEIERPEMVVRKPYKQLKDFRSSVYPRMADKKIFTFGMQLLEQRLPMSENSKTPDPKKVPMIENFVKVTKEKYYKGKLVEFDYQVYPRRVFRTLD
jgi:hypothetical protein